MSETENRKMYPFKIGELLIKEGFVKREDVERALEIQKREEEETKIPFGLILVKKGFLSKENIDMLNALPEIQKDFEKMVIERGLTDRKSISECRKKKRPEELIGDVLVREGYITGEDRATVLNRQMDDIKLAKHAIRHRLMSENDLEEAMRFRRYKRPVGEILCDINLLTLTELNLSFQMQNKRLKLGEILLQLEIIDMKTLESVLEEQNRTGEPLGKMLIRKTQITVDQLYFALSVQYNIQFYRLDGFVFYEKQKIALRDVIGQKFAEENLVLPLFLNTDNLTVAVSDPSRCRIVYEMKSFPSQFRVTCLLIMDEKFEQLFAMLYGEILDRTKASVRSTRQDFPQTAKWIISDPKSKRDESLIEDLFEQFETLRENAGLKSRQSEAGLFKEFLIESHKVICNRFHCSRVSFDINTKNDQVEILAAPMYERLL